MIPQFREDGYLPERVHRATESEVILRFGTSTSRRRKLAIKLRHWLALARLSGAKRFLLDGSFVTSTADPRDVDVVIWIADDFEQQLANGFDAALELEELLVSGNSDDIFAAEDRRDWLEWMEFFGRTRELDGRRKGLVEVEL